MKLELEFLSDRDFPFNTLALLFLAPINIIFLAGMFLAQEPFNYNGLLDLIPLPFVMLNFGLTVMLCFLCFKSGEWDQCF